MTIVICALFYSCYTKYIGTKKICDQNLYLELYERNQLGISYLTDSTNFKIYVGQLNFGDEYYSYKCMSDSVFIYKITRGMGLNDPSYGITIDEYRYNINYLKKEKKFEDQ